MNRHVSPRSRGNSMLRALRLNPLMACLALVPCAETMAAVTHVVDTCTDSTTLIACDGQDDGTLRKSVTCAEDGDTVDLSQLQCSTITLSGALIAQATNLTLVGPSSGTLTLDAAGQSRVLQHYGGDSGTLRIDHLTVANGSYDSPLFFHGAGACIFSTGSVELKFSTVTSCYASSSLPDAMGGAIYALHVVSLYRSTVSNSTARGNGDIAFGLGGGIYADVIELDSSTISGNTASSEVGIAVGGGAVSNLIYSRFSTVSGNKADSNVAGIWGDHVYLTATTVSGNEARYGFIGGVYAATRATILGSTIAGNSSRGMFAAGLVVPNPALTTVTLQSTIIAGNKADGVELDVGTNNGKTISGHNNLIMAHQSGTTVPADTLTDDPLLGPLQDNGGLTQTHALLPGSPAIDHGSNAGGEQSDQRGRPREVGGLPDIGAYEFDPDSIFTTGFGP